MYYFFNFDFCSNTSRERISAFMTVAECDTLDCEHFCINDGDRQGHCECKLGHSLQLDGRHCGGRPHFAGLQ